MGRGNCSNPKCPNDQLPNPREDRNESLEQFAVINRLSILYVVVHDKECCNKNSITALKISPAIDERSWEATGLDGICIPGVRKDILMSYDRARREADEWANRNCGGNCAVLLELFDEAGH